MMKKTFDRYLAGHIRQIAREEEEMQKFAGLSEKKAHQIAAELVKKCGVGKVYLFGSLASGEFSPESDIDIAVEGLPEEFYLKAFGLAGDIAAPAKVDPVLLETALPSLKECILKEGKLLYDLQGKKDCALKKTGGRHTERP